MQVRELMTEPVLTCSIDSTTDVAARLMWEHDCGAIPVVDAQDGAVVGMITDRDVCMAAFTRGKALSEIPVEVVMSERVFVVHADDTIASAEKVMSHNQIRRLPVVDGSERLVGMLSLNDIARHAGSMSKGSAVQREVSRTLSAISAHRSSQNGARS